MSKPESGYTLPVFAVAAAKAALLVLNSSTIPQTVRLDLIKDGEAEIEISQCACLDTKTGLGITISNPGDNLDLTAHTPLWALVNLEPSIETNLILEAGAGLGRTAEGEPAIYKFARELANVNLLPLISEHTTATVRFILPEGRSLATRTSNAAFGILEGLALLGTSAISQPLSAEDKLADFRADLAAKASKSHHLAFCIGANGYNVALKQGFTEAEIVQTANWLGVMLVEAALLQVETITLIGYQGKLLKLAGGIFNTSSHLADGRIEILTTAAVHKDLPLDLVKQISRSPTAEAVHNLLTQNHYEQPIYQYLSTQIEQRAMAYVYKYTQQQMQIKTVLCDRLGNVIKRDN